MADSAGGEIAPSLYNSWTALSWTDENGTVPLSDFEILLNEDGSLGGRAGCNHIGGSYNIDADGEVVTLTASNVYSTDMACGGEGVMEREARFVQLLASSDGFLLSQAGAELTLKADNLSIAFELTRADSNLDPDPDSDPATDLPADPDAPVSSEDWANPWFPVEAAGGWVLLEMTVDDLTISRVSHEVHMEVSHTGFSGRICNGFEATSTDGFTEPSWPVPVVSTLMACGDDLDQLESAFFQALSRIVEVELSQSGLLLSGDGATLRFARPAKSSLGDGESPSVDPQDRNAERLALITRLVVEDLSSRLDLPTYGVDVVSAEAVVWPDGALGCPDPGKGYIQAMVDGYLIVLEAESETFRYHGAWGSAPFLCEAPDAR